ncbi:MAG TPA: hypothetical protein VJ872_00920, partial [Nocardioides sp.]|nr:hypothetical protein [Nocardioides sp.]
VPDAGTTLLPDADGNVKELGPINSSSTKIGVIQSAPLPMLGLTNPNGQVDLANTWLQMKRQGADDWLYFAWQRDSNSGSGFISFEFMKNAAPVACDYSTSAATLMSTCNPWKNRAPGDFMITWDQSGSSTQLYKRVWGGTPGNLTLGAPVAIPISQAEAKYSPDLFRGEAAIDITQAIYGGVSQCITLANVIPSTVTGNSDTADYKDTVLQNIPPLSSCTQTVTTTPSDGSGNALAGATTGIGTGVVPVKDHAVVDLSGGSANASGSIDFHLCKVDAPGLCATGGTDVGSVALTGAYPVTVNSPTAYVTSAGRYCWRAETTADTANGTGPVTDNVAGECFTVTPAHPTLTTNASADVVLGGTISDTASLSGTVTDPATPVINLTGASGPAAGGHLTFKLYGPSSSSCGTLQTTTAAVNVSGDGQYGTPDPQVQPGAVGDYHWVATYDGTVNNTGLTHNSACDDTSEDVSATSVAVSLDTTQKWVPNDSATFSAAAGGDLDGNAVFTLYQSSDCTGTVVYTSGDVAVSGASPQTVHTSNTDGVAAGTYSWKVSYASNNAAQRGIPGSSSCQEVSSLTVDNGSTVHSP